MTLTLKDTLFQVTEVMIGVSVKHYRIMSLALTCIAIVLAACSYTMKEENNQERGGNEMEEVTSSEESKQPEIDMGKWTPDRELIRNYQPAPGEVPVYSFDSASFHKFLSDPTLDTLKEVSTQLFVFRKSGDSEAPIEQELLTPIFNSEYRVTRSTSGSHRIGTWPVYVEFLDFLDEPENFNKLFLDLGIEVAVLRYKIILHPNLTENSLNVPGVYPQMSIWIHTERGEYFLTHFNNWDDPYGTDYLKHSVLYNLEEFWNRYQEVFPSE